MMKIGFTSSVCPSWDLQTMVSKASHMGFDGIQLCGDRGETRLPGMPEVASDPEGVRRLLRDSNVELVSLGTSTALDSRRRTDLARQKAKITELMESAAKLGCPFVRVSAGRVQRRDNHRIALSRIAEAVSSLVPAATQLGVTVLVENDGDFPGSDSMWFLTDAAGHPAVLCCWNQCHAKAIGERPTLSIPRLSRKIGVLHVCDASFDEHGVLLDYKPLGEGDAEIARQIELLKGLLYDRYIVFDWPKTEVESLPPPESILPSAAEFLRGRIEEQQPVLTAYKGDKNAPKMTSRTAAAPAP